MRFSPFISIDLKITVLLLSLICFRWYDSSANDTLRVLFIGNSYTYVNDLPGVVRGVSASLGKTVLNDSYTVGGYSWSQHATDNTCLTKIRQGGWDAVVLQEQSQIPTIDFYRMNYCEPGVRALADSIKAYNPCSRILLFMTWGRRFGGQQCINGYCSPAFVDFNHMQDSLSSAYQSFALANEAACAPVGMAWKKALEDTSTILHSSDNSHPALTGTYLAACVFHDMLWKQTSAGATYTAGLTQTQAARFQEIADSTVYFGISGWGLDIDVPMASFTASVSGSQVDFINTSACRSTSSIHWDFGDGTTGNDPDPIHAYPSAGSYDVTLTVDDCGHSDSMTMTLNILPSGIFHDQDKVTFVMYPSPSDGSCTLTIPVGGSHTMTIRNLQGTLMVKNEFIGNTFRLRTESLQEGFYLVSIDGSTRRLVVSH